MQISINLPPGGNGVNGRTLGLGDKSSKSQETEVVWKPGGDILLDSLSPVDTGILPLTRAASAAHSFNSTLARVCRMRLADALVKIFQ